MWPGIWRHRLRRRLCTALLSAGASAIITPTLALAVQLPRHSELSVVPTDPRACEDMELEPLLLHTVINAADTGEDIEFYRRPCGGVLAPRARLEELRIITDGRPTVLIDGQEWVLLNSFPGLRFTLDDKAAIIALEGEPWVFRPTIINMDVAASGPLTRPKPGAVLHYSAFAFGGDDAHQIQTLQNIELLGFSGTSSIDHQMLALGGGTSSSSLLRIGTQFVHDDPERLQSYRVGDLFGRGGSWGSSRSLLGLQWARNFSLQPGLITGPVEELDLDLRRHAALVINANGLFDTPQQRASLYYGRLGVAPYGPVRVINVPAGFGNRTLGLHSEGIDGQMQLALQRDYYGLGLLRKGFSDYSVEIGALRQGFSGDRYGTLAGSATWRHGFTNRLTGEWHLEATGRQQATGPSLALRLPYLGVNEWTAGISRDNSSGNGTRTGQQWSVSLQNVYDRLGYFLRYQQFSRDFRFAGSALPTNQRSAFDASLTFRAWRGSAFVGASRRAVVDIDPLDPSQFSAARIDTRYTLGYSVNFVSGLAISLFASHRPRSAGQDSETLYALNLGLPLGAWTGSNWVQSLNPQLTAEEDSQQRPRAEVRLGQTRSHDGQETSWQATQSVLGSEFSQLYGSWTGRHATLLAQATHSEVGTGYGVGVASSVALIGGDLYVSRPLGSSFALVRMPEDYGGVQVNGIPASSKGEVIVPFLSPYTDNLLQLDPGVMPLSFQPEDLQIIARVPNRAGVVLTPHLVPRRDALLTLRLQQCERSIAMPLGAYGKLPGREDEFPVGERGQLYVYGVGEGDIVTVHYRGDTCRVALHFPPGLPNPDELQTLGPFSCEGILP